MTSPAATRTPAARLLLRLWLLQRWLGCARGDVQQQHLKTMTVVEDALNDPDWPSLPGTSNDVLDKKTWTNNNQNVREDSLVSIEFNENVQVGMGYITFQPPILGGLGYSSSSATTLTVPGPGVDVSGSSIILNNARTDITFAEATTYTVSFDAGVVLDLGIPADTNAAFSVQFTTGDFSPPTRTSITPIDDANAIDPTGLNIVMTFSEDVTANSDLSLGITLQDRYQRQTPYQVYYQCDDSTKVVIAGNQVTVNFDPVDFALLPCQNYQLTYSAKCFYDTSPNKNWVSALPATQYYDFWTACISTFSPMRNTYDSLISTNIVLTFAEEVVQGTGNIVLTPLGETSIDFDVTDTTRVQFNTPTVKQVTILGDVPNEYLCRSKTMQDCKGKPIDVAIGAGVIMRASTAAPAPSMTLPAALNEQLTGDAYRFTFKPADLTPPRISIVSMYGISESVIRVTVRLDESGTTYCRAYDNANFNPVSEGGGDVPTLFDCTACEKEIKTDGDTPDDPVEGNFVGSSLYDPIRKYAEHEVDVTHLTDKTFYWVYCYSHDIEIPNVNVVTSAQMLSTQRSVRTLDTTPPTFGRFECEAKAGTEDTISVTLSMNEVGRAYCKVVNAGYQEPSPNAVIAEGFWAQVVDTNDFVIEVNQRSTGLGPTGMEGLFRKWDYDVYCWAQDGEGYPYHGPNGMAVAVACSDNNVTTLDLTRPNMRFVFAESISASQIFITLQVDEGAKVWCSAWHTDPVLTSANFETTIKDNAGDCLDNKGRQCGTFWVYDLDDLEDTAMDGVDTKEDYDSFDEWRFNQDVNIVVNNLVEKTDYPYIYCFAEDDEFDGMGDNPNKMLYDDTSNAGPSNVHTIKTGIGTVTTLDESPPSFTKLTMRDPTLHNDRIVVTFSLNEAGTAYCRTTRSDSGETTLRINSILTANFYESVAAAGEVKYITVDKLEDRDAQRLYEASQYDVYCWAMDAAVDTQGYARPNYMLQDYVDDPVGATGAEATSSPQGGKTSKVWVKDMTPPVMIYVSSEALTEDVIQITLQLSEPGTVWCQPVAPPSHVTQVDTSDVTLATYKSYIQGRSGMATFQEYVHEAYRNVDVEVDKIEVKAGTTADPLSKETPYNIYCFAEDDWQLEAENAATLSVNFNYLTNNVGPANEVLHPTVEDFMTRVGSVITLDLTPPSITITGVASTETTITVYLKLDETGTAWCQAVRSGFNVPTILEILDTNFYSTYTYDTGNPTAVTTVSILGYDRPKNDYNSYVTPLVLGTDYDVYCYADDDLCLGCKVTNGVSFTHVTNAYIPIRTKDHTRPNMRYVMAESIAHDQIIITLQVDEGAKIWCGAWITDPGMDGSNYQTLLKNFAPTCQDNKGRLCGTFWVYDLDDMEDTTADLVDTRADYDKWENWKYNRDVDIILYDLVEEQDYPYIYCYAEDDEDDGVGASPNVMQFSDVPADAAPNNVHTMGAEIGTVQTLDESPPSFTYLAMEDPTALNDRIVVTFQLNEAGTAYCRVTRTDSGETSLKINQVLSANFGTEVLTPGEVGTIVVDKLESRDDKGLYEASQYDVYCWAKDSAVNTQLMARPNYDRQDYLDLSVVDVTAPEGGKTQYVWVKDMTPPTVIYVHSEALSETLIQVTLQLNEPGTVWCHPAVPTDTGPYAATHLDVGDVIDSTYIEYIKGRASTFRTYVHMAFRNVDVEVDMLDVNDGSTSDPLRKETPYNIYCFAEDDWRIEAQQAALQSPNFNIANAATPNMTQGDGNEITLDHAEDVRDAIGLVTTLDLTPPSITVVAIASEETEITVTLRLDETGTAWCQAVRKDFNVPNVLEILDTNFYSPYTYDPLDTTKTTQVVLTGYDRPKNDYNAYVTPLVLGTDYDVYCYADDDLCQGCKVTNGVSFSHITDTKTPIRSKDYTMPNMRFIFAESISKHEIIIILQVDEGSKVWCAAWETEPSPPFSSTADAIAAIKAKQTDCRDGKGRTCGTFWIYDLDDLEDGAADLVETRAEYDAWENWKYNQDVDIIVSSLTEEQNHEYIYCYAEDDESNTGLYTGPNTMLFNATSDDGPYNMRTIQEAIGTIQTLDESPPSFTRLALQDPTLFNDRLVVTFQLNEAGTAYCRTTRSDSGETRLHINSILSADFSESVPDETVTGYITVTSLESRDPKPLYEASQYDVYCWAKDSAVDTHLVARPNYMIQDYVETEVGDPTSTPLGGKTSNVWVKDGTAPVIMVVAREALAEDTIQVTLQLNEPGTIWCQIADQDSAGGTYCRDMDVKDTPTTDPCYFESWIKGVDRGVGSTLFRADVHIPYMDYDIDLDFIEAAGGTSSASLVAQTSYHVWCFAEDDWKLEATYTRKHGDLTPEFISPPEPNRVGWGHTIAVKSTIGQVLTLDQTAPQFTNVNGIQYAETILQMTMTLDEIGTIWCKPVRKDFAEPSINEILANNEYNTACSTSACTVAMQGLDPKTQYDIWCYTEDDNVYPQRPNGRKFVPAQKTTLSTLDETPPILTIVSAESPTKGDIRIKVRLEEPGTVWCNSFVHGTAYGTVNFDAVTAAGHVAYVGQGLDPGGPINQNVEVIVHSLVEQTPYDTFCTAQDASNLPSVNKLLDPTTISTAPSVGVITTLDESPPTFTVLGASGIDENTIEVTFTCNEACRAYCRVTRSDSGETSLSVNRILKADFQADQTGSGGGDQTIRLSRLEDDSSLPLLERGTLYDTYCWIRDEAEQYSCYAKDPGADCRTWPRPNYQNQVYVDTAFGGTPPATVRTPTNPAGGKVLHVRTPDTTPPQVIFVEAESTEETSLTITLQLDEPGTAYCKAYVSTQTADAALFTDLSTGVAFKNTVTNWNNIYRNFEVTVTGLAMETKYYVYCVAEDDELMEGQYTIVPQPVSNNKATPMLSESTGRFTLDLTPPIITVVGIASGSETSSTVTVQLDEPGTVWCKAVRDRFDPPSVNQIIAASFNSETTVKDTDFTVLVENLERDTEYDVYCHARDRGTEVEPGVPLPGNPGNDVTFNHVLTTKRDIHTMGDSTAPIIVARQPVLGETNVDLNPIIIITFNEDIQAGTGDVIFTPVPSGPPVVLDVSQANTGTCIAMRAKMSIILSELKLDFSGCSNFFTANTKWEVSFAEGVFTDDSYALNKVPAFGTGGSYYFTTGTTR